jgi:hypothetical protein
MYFMANRPEAHIAAGTRPAEQSQAVREADRDRRAAALCLQAAATAEDEATRHTQQPRAAELISPRPRGRWRTRLT